jgi:hypothetical protein
MKIAILIGLALAWSGTARAQLALQTCDGTPAATVQSTYNLGSVAAGTALSAHLCAQNNGTNPVTIALVGGSSDGFSVTTDTLPYTIAPSNSLEFTVSFYEPPAAAPGTYSTNLTLTLQTGTSLSVFLLATLVAPQPAATVTPASPCTAAGSNGFTFGTLQNGAPHTCSFSVSNGNAQPLTISNISIAGAFQGSQAPTPLTLAPGQATMVVIGITPACGTSGILNGTLTINTNIYALTGQNVDPPLPTPTLALDTSSIGSGEQHMLTMSLPSPAVCSATGNINLTFMAAKNLPVTDDTSIVFLAGSTRSLQFSASPGATSVTIAGQPSAAFQTGTTAGTITFSVSGIPGANQPSISFAIAPAPISIETATASNQITGQLDVAVIGYDNTYSAGPMTFTFFDANNKMIGSPVTADFASNFQSYFAMYTSGSSFLARMSFQVQGNALTVATVTATLNNNAGPAQTGTLTFQ